MAISKARWILAGSLVFLYALSRLDVHTANTSTPQIGAVATVAQADGYFPCGKTIDDLNTALTWSARSDEEEVRRVIANTGSGRLVSGMHVKVLDDALGKRKVRILADPQMGLECWVISEALTQ